MFYPYSNRSAVLVHTSSRIEVLHLDHPPNTTTIVFESVHSDNIWCWGICEETAGNDGTPVWLGGKK